MKITIRIFEDGREFLSKTFDEGVYRIGRSDFSDIPLPHDKVSRSHIEIRISEASAYFTNMASPGTVKINGKARETGEIADGDEIIVGPYKMLMAYGEAAPLDAGDAGFGDPALGGAPLEPAPDMEPAPDGFGTPLKEKSDPGRSAASASVGVVDTDVELKPVVAKLMFTEGPKKGDELVLEAYEVTFGRSKKADIFLDDDRLSRLHAKIVRVGTGYRLVDLNSHNGTFVNGMRVLEHPLSSFDEITLGASKIKFLIHDIVLENQGVAKSLVGMGGTRRMEQTASVAVGALKHDGALELDVPPGGAQILQFPARAEAAPEATERSGLPSRRTQIILGILAGLMIVFFLIPSGDPGRDKTAPVIDDKAAANIKVPPAMPKEYSELSEDLQRSVEGHYNSALKAADAQDFESAVSHLKSIHEYLPYYKKSRELLERYSKKVKEKQIAEAQEKARNDEKQDLAMYLQDGIEYLKEGDFEKAGEAFNSAIVIDPTNPIAAKGLRAADAKVRDLEKLPPEVDPEMEKKKAVLDLFQKAVAALQAKQYQEAINTAEQVRKIELKGDTQYLNEAKQIIDQAKILQKEQFEPFLITAKEKFAEGDYNESRNLCEEMLAKDGAYEEARECVLKAKKNLNRLAKEAYTHGYILESMNRIEEAKQYWNRAKNYVRKGDEYYDKINKKLDYYQ